MLKSISDSVSTLLLNNTNNVPEIKRLQHGHHDLYKHCEGHSPLYLLTFDSWLPRVFTFSCVMFPNWCDTAATLPPIESDGCQLIGKVCVLVAAEPEIKFNQAWSIKPVF